MLTQSVNCLSVKNNNFDSSHISLTELSVSTSNPFWVLVFASVLYTISSILLVQPFSQASSCKPHLALVYLSEFKSIADRYKSLLGVFIRIQCVLSKVFETMSSQNGSDAVKHVYHINAIRSSACLPITFFFFRELIMISADLNYTTNTFRTRNKECNYDSIIVIKTRQ